MLTTEQLVSILEQLDSYNDIMVFYRAQWKRIPTDILPLVHQALDDAEPPDTNNVSKHHFGVWATSETILSSWLVLGGGPSSGFGSRSWRFEKNKKCFFPIHV